MSGTPTTEDRRRIRVGTKVLFAFHHDWWEEGVVTAVDRRFNHARDLLTIELPEAVELPDFLNGGWCIEVQREREEVERLNER